MDIRIAAVVSWFTRIYLDGVPLLIRDETAFLSFVCMLAGTEALAGYFDPAGSGSSANGKRFTTFIEAFYPEPYWPLAENLWDFRNGMAHGFSPRQFALTHHNTPAHFKHTSDGAVVLNAEEFYTAFVSAANSYFAALNQSQELQSAFLARLGSRSGGGFGVGFVDRLENAP